MNGSSSLPLQRKLAARLTELRPHVDEHVTVDRVRRYVRCLSETPAPSTAAAALRTPLLRRLLADDSALDRRLGLHHDFLRTGSTVLVSGSDDPVKDLWYFAHLDTISYLIQPRQGDAYPLVPFGYHLVEEGSRSAIAYRFVQKRSRYLAAARGEIRTTAGKPWFRPEPPTVELRQGDRVVFHTPYREDETTGNITAHVDNAAAVAALAVAAPVLAQAGVDALICFPDEEEGPLGAGSQVMGRGSSRIVGLLPPPELAIISDVHQAGGEQKLDSHGDIGNTTRLGRGAVLAEFSSHARGAVTPPHLYSLAKALAESLSEVGVSIQESNNAYTSRSDDVSVLLKTPHVLLLGFPGFDRHFDAGEPRANLLDIVHLAKSLVYVSVLRSGLRTLLDSLVRYRIRRRPRPASPRSVGSDP